MREADFEAIEEAWDGYDTEGVTAAGLRAGLALSIDHLSVLEQTSIAHKAIVSTIAAALSHPAGIAVYGVGGSWSKEVCLAVKHDGFLTIAIKPVTRQTVSPAGAWPELKPWFKDLAKNRARAESWASRAGGDRVRIPLLRDERPEHGFDETELIRQIVDNPDDRGARLVLADYLLEREDVRGDLIRLDLELADMSPDDVRRSEIERKIEKLVADHGKRLAGRAGEVAAEYKLAGGFVDAITIAAPAFKRYGDELLQSQPVRLVKIKPYNAAAIETLAQSPHLARVRALEFSFGAKSVPLAPLRGFLFEKLEALELRDLITQGTDSETWLTKLAAPRLRKLHVVGGFFGARPFRGLVFNKALCTTLEELTMANLRRECAGTRLESNAEAIADDAFAALALPNLRVVWVNSCWFGTDARMAQLVRKSPALVSFAADCSGTKTYEQLARSRTLEATRLEAPIDQALFEELLKLPKLRSLEVNNIPAADRPRIAETLLALPSTHPLASVWFAGPYHARLRKRFSRDP